MMRILIAEDERPTAEDIRLLVKRILKDEAASIHIETTLEKALSYLCERPIDVLLLDLNLNAKDGFEILKRAVAGSFHTIVLSANINRAIEAFEYGVLDFIPKPYTVERLRNAFQRLRSIHSSDGHAIRYLSIKSGKEIQIFPLEDVRYFKSANVYTELHLANGRTAIHDKSLKQLASLLPAQFHRIHKSYIVDTQTVTTIQTLGGGQYRVILKCGECLPVSRQKIKRLRETLGL